MDSRRAGTIAILSFIVLALIWGLLSIMPNVVSKESSESASASEGNKRAVIVYHSSDGVMHTFTGSIDLPTPCHQLESATSVDFGDPAQVSVKLAIQQPPSVCAEVITEQQFSTTVSSKSIPIFAVWIDGTEARPVILEAK